MREGVALFKKEKGCPTKEKFSPKKPNERCREIANFQAFEKNKVTTKSPKMEITTIMCVVPKMCVLTSQIHFKLERITREKT